MIEGLIGLGTLKPGDVTELLHALKTYAVAPAFQERLLESLFGEERIRNVTAIVAGRSSMFVIRKHAEDFRESSIPTTCPAPSIGTPGHDS